MTSWEIQVKYNGKTVRMTADLEYHSAQIMRIRVHGSKSSVLLENNHPTVRESRLAVRWKIREDPLKKWADSESKLLTDIIRELEAKIKKEFP